LPHWRGPTRITAGWCKSRSWTSAVATDHARSFDRAVIVEGPTHVEGLKKRKGEPRKHQALDRLAQSAPSSQQIFVTLAEQGENLGRATQHYLELFEKYGSMALEQVRGEGLASGTASYDSIRCNLVPVELVYEHASELVTAFGRQGHPVELVAQEAASAALEYTSTCGALRRSGNLMPTNS